MNRPVVGLAATPSGAGYWRVASDGGIFTAGDATFHGSTGNLRLNRPVVGMAATPTGDGYWLVASDGGIFSFGDARFYGSTGNLRLNRPVVGMTATPSGRGYWLVASDGGIFSFGDAKFYGSTGNLRLSQPIVGMSTSPTSKGYWMVAADGGIFSFGDAVFYGAAASACPDAPAIGIASSKNAVGYWVGLANARTYAFAPGSSPSTCSASDRAEADFLRRINDERAARGIAPLRSDSELATYAGAWSAEMARSGFRHSNLGNLLTGRFNLVAENIASGSAGVTAGALHGALMRSDGHRANMLAPALELVGVGVYCRSDGSIWVTQVFARNMSSGSGPAITVPPANPFVRTDSGSASC
ncbi:MAG TPA: CAP domain-containing protein [Acidimicrobiia bacterium]|nr:CAP domain-containing protein [Acidimicrobiia bacterium]